MDAGREEEGGGALDGGIGSVRGASQVHGAAFSNVA